MNQIILQTVSETEYYTVKEAAVVLGLKEISLRQYLQLKKLTTYKFKSLTLIAKKEVEERLSRLKCSDGKRSINLDG